MGAFEEIYLAAKELNEYKLKGILKSCLIDTRQKISFVTLGEKLASEGNVDACKLLIKYGASVNDIARGAAIGGHIDYTEELRKYHGTSVNNVAISDLRQAGYQAYQLIAENIPCNELKQGGYSAQEVAAPFFQRQFFDEVILKKW